MAIVNEKPRVGGTRKDIDDIRRPYVMTIYLTNRQVNSMGGRGKVYDIIRGKKDKIQQEFDGK